MRIVYLHQYFLTPAKPGGTRSYEMARRLVADGHEVHMVTSDQTPSAGGPAWRESEEAGIHVHWARVPYDNRMPHWRRLWAFVAFAFGATRKAASLRPHVIFATSTPLTIAIPAIVSSWWTRAPFVFEVRDMWPDVPIAIGALKNPVVRMLARGLERVTYRRARHIVALAPGMREDIIAKGVPAEKVTVIPNGCDLDVFGTAPSGPTPRELEPWLGARRLVLFAGTLGMVNDVGYLVEVAAQVARLDPEIRFVIIGDGRERDSIRARAAQLGVLDRTLVMRDPVPKGELSRWLHTADLVVALFTGPRVIWKDAVQNKFFDALAAGRPVANNFDGWQSQVAVQEGVGLILDPGDVGTAARQLVAALADQSWLDAVPARARVLAEGRFNRDRLAGELNSVLRAAVRPV